MYESLVFKPCLPPDFNGLSGPKTSSPSPMSPSRGIEIVASSATKEERELFAPAKSGAGGNGRRGLPPYLDEGVPGLGLPLISGGSNCTFAGGGLLNSFDPLVSQDLVGETLPLGV